MHTLSFQETPTLQVPRRPNIARFAAAALSIGFLAAPLPALAADETVSLAPKWTVGDALQYDFRFESARSSGTVGRDEGSKQTFVQEGRLTRRVIAADKDGATLSFVYERVKAEVVAPTQTLGFDSSKPASEDPDNTIAKSMRPVIGRSITVKLDAKGEVESITGNEQPKPSKDPNAPKPQLMSESLIGGEVFRRLLRPVYGLEGAPAQASLKTTWKLEQDTPQPPVGVLTTHKTFTLNTLENGIANIAAIGTVDLAPAVGPNAIKAKISGHKIEGTIEWDTAAGALKSFSTINNVIVEGEDYAGTNRRLDTTTTIQITRVAPTTPTTSTPASKPK